jgi:hypothetical protein
VNALLTTAFFFIQSGHAPEDRRIKFIVDMEKSFEDIREDLYYVVSHLVYKYVVRH